MIVNNGFKAERFILFYLWFQLTRMDQKGPKKYNFLYIVLNKDNMLFQVPENDFVDAV